MLTTLCIPDGCDDVTIRKELLEEDGIEIGGGLGVFAGKVWRIGLMGESSNERNVTLVLNALEKRLRAAGQAVTPGAAVQAAARVYQ